MYKTNKTNMAMAQHNKLSNRGSRSTKPCSDCQGLEMKFPISFKPSPQKLNINHAIAIPYIQHDITLNKNIRTLKAEN
jgi:hypothetical protein